MSSETVPAPPDPRDQKRYFFGNTVLRHVLTQVVKSAFRLFTVIRVSGVENLPREGAVVLAANHMTNFDVFPMQFVLPRLIFFMGKEELFRNPLMDAVLRRLGGFPVYRGARDEWAIQHASRVLEHGQMLGIFPEGKRSKGVGLSTAKTGAARLAITAQCPIVPMAVVGTQRMFRRFPRRTRLTLVVGAPIFPEPEETALALTDRLMFALADLLPPKLRGAYAKRPEWFKS